MSQRIPLAAGLLTVEGRVWSVREELLPALAVLDGTVTMSKDAFVDEQPDVRTNGSVATVPLKGVLMPSDGGLFGFLFGGGGLDRFRNGLDKALSDASVKRIVLDVDSPGGLVDQIPETADLVYRARRTKPVTAIVNTLAASAAYWIASQADEVVMTPSGEAGSIGVYTIHRDLSGQEAQRGVKHTIVSAGRYKTETNPYEPLDAGAQDFLQQGVDDYYAMFVKAVARGRGATVAAIRNGYGEGRVLTAQRAVEAGLADRIATFDEVVRQAAKRKASDEIVPEPELEDEDAEPTLTVTVGGRRLSVPGTAENRRRIGSVPDLFAPGVNDEKEEAADAG